MAGAVAVGGLSLAGLGVARGFWPVMGLWTVHCLASLPLMALVDGIALSLQQRRRERGEDPGTFFHLRVWGTIGYIVPGLLLFVPLRRGMPVRWAVASGAVFAQHIPSSTFAARGEGIRSDEQLRAWVESFVAKAGPSAASRAPMPGPSVRVRSGRR